MGNKIGGEAGCEYYSRVVSSMKIVKLTFREVEKLLIDKSVILELEKDCPNERNLRISKKDYDLICEKHFYDNTKENSPQHKDYLNSLFNYCLVEETQDHPSTYKLLLCLLPILVDHFKSKVKSLNIIIHYLEDQLTGFSLYNFIIEILTWNLLIGAKAIETNCDKTFSSNLKMYYDLFDNKNINAYSLYLLGHISSSQRELSNIN